MRLLVLLILCFSVVNAADNPYLKKIAESTGDKKVRALIDYVNVIYRDSSNIALPYAIQAEALSKKDPASKLHYSSLTTLASVYHDLGKYDSSVAVAERGLRYAASKKDSLGRAFFLVTLADVYKVKGQYEKAIGNFLEAIKQAELHRDTAFLAYVYNATGITYYDVKEYEKSAHYLRTGLRLKNVQNSEDRLTEYYLNIGSAYSNLAMQDSAIYFWKQCNALAEKNDYHDMMSASYNNLAGAFYSLGQYDKTLEYGLKSLHLAEKYNDRQSTILYNVNIGELYGELGQFKKSYTHLNKGIELARKLGYKRLMALSYRAISNVYEMDKDYKNSLLYFKKYLDVNDSLLTEEKQKQISELSASYETEKKQRRIEVLSKESALQKSEVEKQKLLRNSMMGVALLIGGMGLLVFRGYRQKKKANVLLTEQNDQIIMQREQLEMKNKDITDSITYGKRIQTALLPDLRILNDVDHFLLFKPRDIVSGDFYWIEEVGDKKILVVADCTGHGVPGAFMSMIGISLLNDLVKVRRQTDPGKILNALREGIINSLKAEGEQVKDGMDMSIAVIDFKNKVLQFAGANNSGYLIRKKVDTHELITLQADKMPVGNYLEDLRDFNTLEMQLQEDDKVILLTDGFADQFGGPQGKKFRVKQFKDHLLENASLPLKEQGKHLENKFIEWQGSMEQVDDVCVMGIGFADGV